MNFNDFLKKDLNGPQREAVEKNKGAILVVAGAGSGKTRVITARMANLILNKQADPQSILALTFTNKAAGEMKERLTSFLGATTSLPFVGTFHAYALLLLRTNPNLLPFTDFTIIDEDDQKKILKKILKKSGLEKQISPSKLSHQISKVKNRIKSDEDDEYQKPFFKELFLAYETEKAAAHCFDFDDLLLTILKIFEKNKDFKKKFQSRIKHILVDEYQDTNSVQHELLKNMGLNEKNKFVLDSLCAVGDQDQSIYSWRGAVVANMISFQKDFSPVETIKIEQNYRSVQPILKAANEVIKNNQNRHPKKLWSDKKARNRILSVSCKSGYQEADTVSAYLKSLPKKSKLKDVAILYRTHFQSRSIEESLIRSSIPYLIVGGIRFYERKEIKDLLAYLRLIVNPFDRTSLFRVINCPQRGLGAKFEELLYTEWNNNPLLDFKQILKFLLDEKKFKIKGTKADSIKLFLKIFKGLDKKEKASVLISEIIDKTMYLSYLRKAYDQRDADTKIENIQELVQSIENFEKRRKKATLETFLHEIALLQEKIEGNKNQTDFVQMMTLHAAKGLEFDTIIIAGLEENLLPSSRSMNSNEALEEERRLFYVGMTRARERLVLTRAAYRNTYGQIADQVVSRFLTEVPNNLIHHIDLTNVHSSKIKTLLSAWLGTAIESTVTVFGAKAQISAKAFKKEFAVPPKFLKKSIKTKTNSKKSKSGISTGVWKRNQPVLHKTFGMGVVKKIERVAEDKYYLTIFFKSGEKRISSRFVKQV